ncbi:MAG: metallophosphoesterase [Deltaproteobacteria bacterium]|nr:metallophosphoesterase [Deltaproteobacteria bacterium]
MSLFLLTFFLIYGGTHAYAFFKAKAAIGFGWGTSLALVPFLALLTCGPVLVHHLGERGFEGLSRAAAWISYTWMGLLFFFTWMNLAIDGVNLLWRLGTFLSGKGWVGLIVYGKPAFLALAGLSLALGAYSFVEADRIRLEHVRVATDKLPPGIERVRVAQISDIHFGLMVRHGKAAAIAELVERAGPDILVSTGDLVDARINHLDGLPEILRGIRAPAGKYLVTGNHEFYAGIGQSLDFARRAGFTILRGETATAGGLLRIAGVDDPAVGRFGTPPGRTEEDLLSGPPSPLFTLLLKHRPVATRESRRRFDLQLSGHTHDGQLFPFRILTRFAYPLLGGLHVTRDGGAVYVSRGTGTWGPPMRFLSPPEVTIIDIERRV